MRATKQQLIEAKALIEDKKNWTTGLLARDASGKHVAPNSPEATCFCALGALAKVMGKGSIGYLFGEALPCAIPALELHKAALVMGYLNIPKLNDRAGHEKVMLMYKRAIEETQE